MSWLSNPDRDFKYICEKCKGKIVISLRPTDESYREPVECECGGTAHYDCFLPIQVNVRSRVSFDQNGRKAYMISDGKGKVSYVSASRVRYQETGDIVPQYTRAYEDHLKKEGKSDLLESTSYTDLVKQRAASQERSKRARETAKESVLTKDNDL